MSLKLHHGLTAALCGAITIVAVQPPLAVAELNEQKFAAVAKVVTVVVNGQNPGSGVIIAKEDDTYSVLTANHVIATPDDYEIVTSDRQTHALNYSAVTKLPDVDLAVVQFTSDQNYPVAVMGDSEAATEGSAVYISGWPHPGQAITQRIFQFTKGTISGLPLGSLEDGYGLVYTNVTRSGMSGGPVFDDQGLLMGLHGRAEGEAIYNPDTGNLVPVQAGFNLGIPINTFLQKAAEVGIALPYAWIDYSPVQATDDVGEAVFAAAITPDGRTLISGHQGGKVRLWDLATGELEKTLGGSNQDIFDALAISSNAQTQASTNVVDLAIAPNGQTLASLHYVANGDGYTGGYVVGIWDLNAGTLQATLPGGKTLAMSPEGKLLATPNRDQEAIQLWDIQTGQLRHTLRGHQVDINQIEDIAFAPDGQITVADKRVVIWDSVTDEQPRILEFGRERADCVAISPDGRTLATHNLENRSTIIFSDLQTGEELRHLQYFSYSQCDSLFFGPSGQTLVYTTRISALEDEGISIWNLQTEDRFFYPQATAPAAFSPDGQTFVIGQATMNRGGWIVASTLSIERARP